MNEVVHPSLTSLLENDFHTIFLLKNIFQVLYILENNPDEMDINFLN